MIDKGRRRAKLCGPRKPRAAAVSVRSPDGRSDLPETWSEGKILAARHRVKLCDPQRVGSHVEESFEAAFFPQLAGKAHENFEGAVWTLFLYALGEFARLGESGLSPCVTRGRLQASRPG